MEFRPIGSSDLHVSAAGLGCNNFGGRLDLEGSSRVVHAALDMGVNFLDTADSYGNRGGSELVLGEVLRSRRKHVVLATKFGWPMDDSASKQGASDGYIRTALEASLTRLKTDWIDLYQLHLPDPATPIDETLRALESLIQQGKVRYIGCSNFTADEFATAQSRAGEIGIGGFISCQDHYNLLTRGIEATLIPELRLREMSLLPYAPLAAGLLTGKFRRDAPMPEDARLTKSPKQADRYLNERSWRIIEELISFSSRRGRSLLDLAVAWVAAREPVCSVIAGAMTPAQVAANVAALEWRLSEEELTEIDRITMGSIKAE